MNISTSLNTLNYFFDSKLVYASVSIAGTRIGCLWLLGETHSWRAAFQCVYFRGSFFDCLWNTSFSYSRQLHVYKIINFSLIADGELGNYLENTPPMPLFNCPLHQFPKYFCWKLICRDLYLQGCQVWVFAFLTLPSSVGVPSGPCQVLDLPVLCWWMVRRRSLSLFPVKTDIHCLHSGLFKFLYSSECTCLGISETSAIAACKKLVNVVENVHK